MIPTALCTAYPDCLKGSPGRVTGAVPGDRVPDARSSPDRAGGRQGVVELNGIGGGGGGGAPPFSGERWVGGRGGGGGGGVGVGGGGGGGDCPPFCKRKIGRGSPGDSVPQTPWDLPLRANPEAVKGRVARSHPRLGLGPQDGARVGSHQSPILRLGRVGA